MVDPFSAYISTHEFLIGYETRRFLITPGDMVGFDGHTARLYRQKYEIPKQLCLRGAVSVGWLEHSDDPLPEWSPLPLPALKYRETQDMCVAPETKVRIISDHLVKKMNTTELHQKYKLPVPYIRFICDLRDNGEIL